MGLLQQIDEDFKTALKSKDHRTLSCLRLLKTSIKNKKVELGRELKDEEIQSVVSSMIKKGKDAIKEFKNGGREDLATKEEEDIKVLYRYLPEQLSEEEIESILKEIIKEVSAQGPKDMGKVMKIAMSRMAGKAQGREVSEIARRLLS